MLLSHLKHTHTHHHLIQNYLPENKPLHATALPLIYAAEPWLILKLLPWVALFLWLSKHTCLKSFDSSKAAIYTRTTRALTSERPKSRMTTLRRGCGLYTPGPTHHPDHNHLGKGRGEPPEGIKATRGAEASFLTCLKFTARLNKVTLTGNNNICSFATSIASAMCPGRELKLAFLRWYRWKKTDIVLSYQLNNQY